MKTKEQPFEVEITPQLREAVTKAICTDLSFDDYELTRPKKSDVILSKYMFEENRNTSKRVKGKKIIKK